MSKLTIFLYSACLVLYIRVDGLITYDEGKHSNEFVPRNVENFPNFTISQEIDLNDCFNYEFHYKNRSYSVCLHVPLTAYKPYKKNKKIHQIDPTYYGGGVVRHAVRFKKPRMGENAQGREDNIDITPRKSRGRVCTVTMVIDYSFLKYIAHSDLDVAAAKVINSMEHVNSIFRSTDFNMDGVPDNIGFKIKRIIIFNYLPYSNQVLFPFSGTPIEALLYIKQAMRISQFKETCIGIIYTAQIFTDRVIGISVTATKISSEGEMFVGGICSSNSHVAGNLIVLTYRNSRSRMLAQDLLDRSLAHEIGHTFGAVHDTEKNCDGYLMQRVAKNLSDAKQAKFSICSKRQINAVLRARPHCFLPSEDIVCGNGILEMNEECDCGSTIHCKFNDHCCLPFDGSMGCQINRSIGFECHPSQGLCCDEKCKYRDLSHLGFQCKDYIYSPCSKNNSKCGFESKCVDNSCHNLECTRLNLIECSCPSKLAEYCQICCSYDGVCQSSLEISKRLVKNDAKLLRLLSRRAWLVGSSHNFYKLCSNGTFCRDVIFLNFPVREYCLLHGILGTCSATSKCTRSISSYISLPSNTAKRVQPNCRGFSDLIIVIICILQCFY